MVEFKPLLINDFYALGIILDLPKCPIHLILYKQWLISDGSLSIDYLIKKNENLKIIEVQGETFEALINGKICNYYDGILAKEGVLNKQVKDLL